MDTKTHGVESNSTKPPSGAPQESGLPLRRHTNTDSTLSHGKQLRVCTRLAEVRAQHFGPRGKSRFARELGIGSSTYDRYERDRMPPADLLLKAAQLTGVRLEWLITGEGPREAPPPVSGRIAGLIERLRDLLRRRQDFADHVDMFLTDLEHRAT